MFLRIYKLLVYNILVNIMNEEYDTVSLEIVREEARKIAQGVRSSFDKIKGNSEIAQKKMADELESRIKREYDKNISVEKARTKLCGINKHNFNFIEPEYLSNNYSQPIVIDCTADIFCDKNMENYKEIRVSFGQKELIQDCQVLEPIEQKYRIYYGEKSTWSI